MAQWTNIRTMGSITKEYDLKLEIDSLKVGFYNKQEITPSMKTMQQTWQ